MSDFESYQLTLSREPFRSAHPVRRFLFIVLLSNLRFAHCADEDAVAFLGVRAGNLADMQSTRQGILDKVRHKMTGQSVLSFSPLCSAPVRPCYPC